MIFSYLCKRLVNPTKNSPVDHDSYPLFPRRALCVRTSMKNARSTEFGAHVPVLQRPVPKTFGFTRSNSRRGGAHAARRERLRNAQAAKPPKALESAILQVYFKAQGIPVIVLDLHLYPPREG
jgi:hypothetical protein